MIILPVLFEFVGGRELAAGYLQGDLHAAVPDVVVVLHSPGQGIPGGSVRNAVLEGRGRRLAGHPPGHLGVVPGIDQGQVLEDVVVGGQGGRRRVRLEHCAQGTCFGGSAGSQDHRMEDTNKKISKYN